MQSTLVIVLLLTNIQQRKKLTLITRWKMCIYQVKTLTWRTWHSDWKFLLNEYDGKNTSLRNQMKLMMQQQSIFFLFKSVLTPPKNEHINVFEEELYDLARNIEFKIRYYKINLIKMWIRMIKTRSYLFLQTNLTTLQSY